MLILSKNNDAIFKPLPGECVLFLTCSLYIKIPHVIFKAFKGRKKIANEGPIYKLIGPSKEF